MRTAATSAVLPLTRDVVLSRPRAQPVAAEEREAQVVRPDARPDRQADLQRQRGLGKRVAPPGDKRRRLQPGRTADRDGRDVDRHHGDRGRLQLGHPRGRPREGRDDRRRARRPADGDLPPGLVRGGADDGPSAPTTTNGYWMQVDGSWSCAIGTFLAGPPPTCTSTPASRPVKLVTITVRDGSAARARPLHRELDLRLLDRLTNPFDSRNRHGCIRIRRNQRAGARDLRCRARA